MAELPFWSLFPSIKKHVKSKQSEYYIHTKKGTIQSQHLCGTCFSQYQPILAVGSKWLAYGIILSNASLCSCPSRSKDQLQFPCVVLALGREGAWGNWNLPSPTLHMSIALFPDFCNACHMQYKIRTAIDKCVNRTILNLEELTTVCDRYW